MSPSPQILHVIAELDGYGLTRRLEMLVARQLAAGLQVRVVALAAARQALEIFGHLGVDCRVLDRRWRRDPFAAMRLVVELRRQPFELLHLWGQPALDYVTALQRLPAWRRFFPRTPAVTSLPNQTLLNSQPNGNLAPGVASPNPTGQSRQQLLAEQSLPEDAILIAVAGPLTRSQQVDEAIWYFELVRTLDQRVRLLIFGDGPERHRFERFSRLASEPSAIRFLGYRTDFRELLPHTDLFWHTGDAGEALPLTMLEAMASGVPVVVNDGPGCRQAVTDGENGYLIADKDRAAFARQTRRLLQDGQHAKQISVSATQTIAERFSVEAMARAYAKLYNELLNR